MMSKNFKSAPPRCPTRLCSVVNDSAAQSLIQSRKYNFTVPLTSSKNKNCISQSLSFYMTGFPSTVFEVAGTTPTARLRKCATCRSLYNTIIFYSILFQIVLFYRWCVNVLTHRKLQISLSDQAKLVKQVLNQTLLSKTLISAPTLFSLNETGFKKILTLELYGDNMFMKRSIPTVYFAHTGINPLT